MAGSFDGKIALVTGGATGIGFGTAQAFARSGATVVIAGRRAERGAQAVESIRSEGGKALFIQADVAQEEQVEALMSQIMERFGRLDCAFNNAGVLNMKPLTDYTLAEWNNLIATNLTGIWLGMKYQIPAMLQSGHGAIVNMSSVSAVAGMSYTSAYAATKGGVISLTIAAAIEYAKRGIRVNAISTGAVRTEMTDAHMTADIEAQIGALYPLGRIGKEQDIADAVLFLCSDASSFITGQNLMVDGGFTIQ